MDEPRLARADLQLHRACSCGPARGGLNGDAARMPPIRVLKMRAAPAAHVHVGAELKQAEVAGERLPRGIGAQARPLIRLAGPSQTGAGTPRFRRSVIAARRPTAEASANPPGAGGTGRGSYVGLRAGGRTDELLRAAAAAISLASVSPRSPMHTAAKGYPSLCRSCFMESTRACQNLGNITPGAPHPALCLGGRGRSADA
jgi:hypothetical protein